MAYGEHPDDASRAIDGVYDAKAPDSELPQPLELATERLPRSRIFTQRA
jgi:hypothetical protein